VKKEKMTKTDKNLKDITGQPLQGHIVEKGAT